MKIFSWTLGSCGALIGWVVISNQTAFISREYLCNLIVFDLHLMQALKHYELGYKCLFNSDLAIFCIRKLIKNMVLRIQCTISFTLLKF